MFISRIDIQKYRHLEEISLGPLLRPSDASDLVVLAGPNGGGKSSVLELVSLALSNMYSLTYSLNRTQPSSSFEVIIGLLPNEVELIRQYASDPQRAISKEVAEYIYTNHSYRRSFNFPGGEYAKNPTIHNQVHDVVLQVLRGSWARPLGFHLGADRSYQKSPFKRDLLFNYSQYNQSSYVWSYAFQATGAQYKDMFDFLITWRYHFTRALGSYYLQKEAGVLPPGQLRPEDHYGAILRKVFPGYEFVDKDEDAPSDLHVRIPSGDIISFSDLSSGEKEVFFTLCFFQRHNVEEAVIIIDEPELHLHPSLARVLVRTMLELKPRNQIWLATQNSEVIDEAGRDKVAFVRRDESTKKAALTWAADEETALSLLRDLFGQTGYIGLARAMVFTEGRNASTDRKMFSKLFPHSSKDIKIIPASGCSEVERINRAVLAILQSNLGWCRFYLIRDRDYIPPNVVQAMKERSGDHLFVLNRHEIENYLMDFDLIAQIANELFDKRISSGEVKAAMQDVARAMAGDVLRDMVTYRLNLMFRSEDFAIPALQKGEVACDNTNVWSVGIHALQEGLRTRSSAVVQELKSRVDGHQFNGMFEGCKTEIERALAGDQWLDVFPGKELMRGFCQKLGIGKPPVLQNAVIKELAGRPERVPDELKSIIASVASK